MGISFGKRKVKIKLLGQTETVTEEEKPKVPVPIYQPVTVSKAKPKVNRTFKDRRAAGADFASDSLSNDSSVTRMKLGRKEKNTVFKILSKKSAELNLSDFTVYVLVNSRADSFQTGNRTCRSTGVQKQACYSLSV